MVVRVHDAADQRHQVGAQRHRRTQRYVAAQSGAHDHVDAEFLPQFTGQRLGVGLTGRDLAAGQFPQPGQFRRAGALRHQQCTVDDQRTGDHDLDRHGE